MKIHEYQAKDIIAGYGISIPEGRVAETAEQARDAAAAIGCPVVVKAQVHAGGRGKAGGVKLVNSPEEAFGAAQQILALRIKDLPVKKLYVTKAVDIAEEFYVGLTVDRVSRRAAILVSRAGGVDIEQAAEETPEKIGRALIDPFIGVEPYVLRQALYGGGFSADEVKNITPMLAKLCRCFLDKDASMAEINPLVKTKTGEYIALDAKIDFDDNALYRHAELNEFKEESETDELEAEAHAMGLAYVRLDGEVGIIGNGAGLVMATLDMVAQAGLRAANFLDIGGGTRAEGVANSLKILLKDPNVRGILINVFGGITRCDEVARGIIDGAKEVDINVPIVIRLKGTNGEQGREMLQAEGYDIAASGNEAASRIVELIQAGKN